MKLQTILAYVVKATKADAIVSVTETNNSFFFFFWGENIQVLSNKFEIYLVRDLVTDYIDSAYKRKPSAELRKQEIKETNPYKHTAYEHADWASYPS